MKLFLAAPDSGLPSALTALVAQESAMHFFMNEVFAAPASALPSLPTALLSQLSSAMAEPTAKVASTAARNTFRIMFLSFTAGISVYRPSARELTASSILDQGPAAAGFGPGQATAAPGPPARSQAGSRNAIGSALTRHSSITNR